MKVVSPFGPKIGIIKIPKKIINQINQEFEKIVKNKNLSKKNDYSKKLVGQVKQEIELSKSFIDKHLKKFINENINNETSLIIITHYPRILQYLKPDFVHIMNDGKLIKTGGLELVEQLEEHGYEFFK